MCECVEAYSGNTGGVLAIPAASELRESENYNGDFPETTAFERYAVKTSEKGNCIIHWAYRDLIRSLCVPLGLKKSHRKVYIDSRMLSTTVANSPRTTSCSKRIKIAQPIN